MIGKHWKQRIPHRRHRKLADDFSSYCSSSTSSSEEESSDDEFVYDDSYTALVALLISLYLRKISSDLSFFLGVRTNVIIEKNCNFFFFPWSVFFCCVCILLNETLSCVFFLRGKEINV